MEFIPSNHGGPKTGVYIIKIGSLFYRTLVNTLTKSTIHLRCFKDNIHKNSYSNKCRFRVTLKLLQINDPEIGGFHDTTNLVVKPGSMPFPHSCDGFHNIHEARHPKYSRIIAP